MAEIHLRGVVAIDLDGTLLRDTTVSSLLGVRFGDPLEIAELERAYSAGEIGNDVFAERSARTLRGVRLDDVAGILRSACWLDGIRQAVVSLHESDLEVVLASITWAFASRMVADHFGFDGACGTEMGIADGVLDGDVRRYCLPADKAAFAVDRCRRAGLGPNRLAALGDSQGDLPLFAAAGLSVAVNGSEPAVAAADVSVRTRDLRDAVPLILAYFSTLELAERVLPL
jgi:phosphoserine phosphatase